MAQTKLTASWTAHGEPATVSARLSVPEAATYCGVSVSYLNKLRCIGGGPVYIARGRRVIYDTRDLDTWLASGRRISTANTGGEA
jgi:hypothetical protein